MKKVIIFIVICFLFMSGYEASQQSGNQNETVLTIDVRTNYPQKKRLTAFIARHPSIHTMYPAVFMLVRHKNN